MGARKSKDWWKNHYDNWCASKLSMGVYSSNNGISKSTFYGWIKRFRKLDSTDEINENSKCPVEIIKKLYPYLIENLDGYLMVLI